ncbi:MAG: J domain-containing protein [Myxococcales bacterium]|nr:J domain-containing protein [Myxococcales bacterium]
MTALFVAQCSIASTKRKRFVWAVWTSGPPRVSPFRRPDLSGGGEPSHEAALAKATAAAGGTAALIEPEWARAWLRVMRGHAAWLGEGSMPGARSREARDTEPRGDAESVWSVLGVPQSASRDELRLAFRRRALLVHPDHGGTNEAFRNLVLAYKEADRRARRPKPQR